MLYIIRHGKTDWNLKYKLQGRTDIPLNEEGREMARRAHDEYKDVHFDICFCSPLVRAKETAELLLEGRDVPVFYDDRLMEMSFGVCEGQENTFDHPEWPIYNFFKAPDKYKEAPEGAETFEQLFARTGSFLEEKVFPLLEEGKDVVIVGHGAMNSSIVCRIKDLPIKDFWSEGIENCKLKRLI